jgi:hypothetical protein
MSQSSIHRILETYSLHYYGAKSVGTNWAATKKECEWTISREECGGVLLGTEQLRLSVTRLVVVVFLAVTHGCYTAVVVLMCSLK